MLSPKLCPCGCLQPLLPGDALRNKGHLFSHGPNYTRVQRPSYVEVDTRFTTPCWVWQGALNKWGYAKIVRQCKTQGAHRLFYRAYVNPDLPPSVAGSDGLDHLCRVRKCVNPSHLKETTCIENIRAGRVAKLSYEQAMEIRFRALLGEKQLGLAQEFNISKAQVCRIKLGHRWTIPETVTTVTEGGRS